MPDLTPLTEPELRELAARNSNRLDLWADIIRRVEVESMAEVGVYRGAFAAKMLEQCPSLRRYTMVDPWRHLDDWNKPANKADDGFEKFYQEVLARTQPYADKRVVLRGRTAEVVDQIPDSSLDLVYIDGDHTLRGITTDLVKLYPKVKEGGYIAGDDFCRWIFQHSREYEPTLVFPFAVYFAEAHESRIYALPHRQFMIRKQPDGFAFVDLTGRYGNTTLKNQLTRLVGSDSDDAKKPAGVEEGRSAARRLVQRFSGRRDERAT